jgi:hypothetical protein
MLVKKLKSYMHAYFFRAIIKLYNIKGNNNLKKLKINFIMIFSLNIHQSLIEVKKITSNKI